MLILHGPAKVDLIFPDEPHEHEPPWVPRADNLQALDSHFWDWILWLRAKEAAGKNDLVATELRKLFDHLLHPLGVEKIPLLLSEAVARYQTARDRAESRTGRVVSRALEREVAPVLGREIRGQRRARRRVRSSRSEVPTREGRNCCGADDAEERRRPDSDGPSVHVGTPERPEL